MRILHIIDSLSLGGAQQIVKGIVENGSNGAEVALYVLRRTNKMMEIDPSHTHVHRSSSRYSLSPLLEMKDLIERKKIDILHCHLFRSQVYGYLLKRLFFPEIRLIFHEHGQAFGSDSASVLEDVAYKHFLRFSRGRVDLHIAISKAIRRKLASAYRIDPGQIIVLYNYINTAFFDGRNTGRQGNQAIARKPDGPGECFTVGFAGRLIFRKGWKTFLEAAERLSAEPGIRFLMAGDGKDRAKLLDCIEKMGLRERVNYLGFVKDMPSFYYSLSCLAIPSYWEAMGLTELEAQAMEVPVIATDTEGLNEVVTHGLNCLLARGKDPADLAEKILTLSKSPLLVRHLKQEGLKNVQKYDLNQYRKRLDQIYLDLGRGNGLKGNRHGLL